MGVRVRRDSRSRRYEYDTHRTRTVQVTGRRVANELHEDVVMGFDLDQQHCEVE